MHIKEYFDTLAEEMSGAPLPEITDAAELLRWQSERRSLLRRAWNLPDPDSDEARRPPAMTVTGITEAEGYRIERLYFEALPGLIVTANIYVPRGLVAPAPAILYVCGHAPRQKLHYQEHGRRFAQLGFVTMIVDTIQHGEVPGLHHGLWDQGRFQWVSRGYSPVAAEAWNAVRAIDLLCARDDVDPQRIGVTGISGGGAVTWWAAALDERITAIASSSGTGIEHSHLAEHTLDVHCDCFFPNNPYGWSVLETYLLVAPRPTLIVAARHDHVFTTSAVDTVRQRLGEVYERVGHPESLDLLVTDSEHQYTSGSRRAIASWMLSHVAGVPTSPQQVEDFDGVTHPDAELLVLPRPGRAVDIGEPGEQARFLTSRLDEWFVARDVTERDDSQLAAAILEECLGFSPVAPPALDVRIDHAFQRAGRLFTEFSFASEEPWRLRGQLRSDVRGLMDGPLVVVLRSASDGQRLAAHGFADARRPGGPQAVVDVRGSGDTAWHPSLNWHVRRAARVLGRSIAGMQVYDALRAVQAVRELSGEHRIELAGEGDLAAVALVCGILDPTVTVIVRDTPPSFDMASPPDGTEGMIEVTNILRFTDIPDLQERLTAAGRFVPLDDWVRER